MTRAFKILTFQASALVAGSADDGDRRRSGAGRAAAGRRRADRQFHVQGPVVTVKPGTTVTWTNGDDIPHTVVSKDGAFKSKVLDTGDRFSFTFAKPGQFGYFCSLHPHMTGTIVVKA